MDAQAQRQGGCGAAFECLADERSRRQRLWRVLPEDAITPELERLQVAAQEIGSEHEARIIFAFTCAKPGLD